jgi:serine/threonine-protein kinase
MTDVSSGGHVIAGRYELMSQLGQGGMGSVWRARDLTLGSPVAIKLIDAALGHDEGLRERFSQEARSAAALRSPHVVQILDYGVDAGVPFMAMELLDGESLAERLARVGILSHGETARVLLDVARAMKKAHDAGIIHRDLKPDNIFLVRNDDQEIAKVLDFGIAKATGPMAAPRSSTRTGALLGTLPYMSPEQATAKPIDWRSDVWAMGVIAFECVCGSDPFTSESPGELVLQICAHPLPVPSQIAAVPPGFDAWWARAASRDPAQRFQSAKELAEALAAVLVSGAGTAVGSVATNAPSPALAPSAAVSGRATTFGRSALTTDVATMAPRRGAQPRVLGGIALVVAAATGLAWVALRPTARAVPAPATEVAAAVAPTATPADVGAAPSGEPGAAASAPVVAPADPAPQPAAPASVTPGAAAAPRRAIEAPRPGRGAAPGITQSTPAPPPAKKRRMD